LLALLAALMGEAPPGSFKLTHTRLQVAVSFVAGLMLGLALLGLLPHASHELHSVLDGLALSAVRQTRMSALRGRQAAWTGSRALSPSCRWVRIGGRPADKNVGGLVVGVRLAVARDDDALVGGAHLRGDCALGLGGGLASNTPVAVGRRPVITAARSSPAAA